jgi:hypothetical protein
MSPVCRGFYGDSRAIGRPKSSASWSSVWLFFGVGTFFRTEIRLLAEPLLRSLSFLQAIPINFSSEKEHCGRGSPNLDCSGLPFELLDSLWTMAKVGRRRTRSRHGIIKCKGMWGSVGGHRGVGAGSSTFAGFCSWTPHAKLE